MKRSASSLVDYIVRAKDGDVGTVEQFYFDDLTWILRYMAVHIGDPPPGRNVLISLAALGKPDWKKKVFPVNLTMAQVRSSPPTDIDEPVSRQHEVELHEHCALPVYWGGGFYFPFGYGSAAPFVCDGEPAAETLSPSVRKADPHLRSTREITGFHIHATDGNIGHVEDCLVDDGAWVIRYFVVDTRNWLPDRRVLVSPQWITSVDWADKKVLVDLTRDAVKKCPPFDPSRPLSLDKECKILGHLQKTEIREWVAFQFHAPPGAEVYVAGTFNSWDPKTIRLGDNGKGTYTATVLLPLGRYEYKFLVNGDWRNGANCGEPVPNACGTTNDVLVVGRTTARVGHLHTFSPRPSGVEGRLWSTSRG